MPAKLLRCVKEVKKKGGKSARYAWPICIKSTGLKPHKRKKKEVKKKNEKE